MRRAEFVNDRGWQFDLGEEMADIVFDTAKRGVVRLKALVAVMSLLMATLMARAHSL